MRFTKIIATIGPTCNTKEKIEQLARHGVNVARLNFSHGDYDYHGKVLDSIEAINRKGDVRMATMLDTRGPEIRTGDVKKPIAVKKNQPVIFTVKPMKQGKHPVVFVDYPGFVRDVAGTKRILIDNGTLELNVHEIKKDYVVAIPLEDAAIGSRRHLNIPGAWINLPSFTPKDWKDIDFGIERGVDFFAVSFIRTGADIKELRAYLNKHKSPAEIIAKVETAQAVEHLDEIIDASDVVMVARGDLGAEIPFEQVPQVQERIVSQCRAKGKTVIVATQMLESMIENPMPTRAEVTDVAHAAMSLCDSTMLSGESASGMFPFKSVSAMDRILRATESSASMPMPLQRENTIDEGDMPRQEQALAASILASNLQATAMIVISRHGLTAKAVSHCRPHVPILVFTDSESVERRLRLVWGIEPFVVPFSDVQPDRTVERAIKLSLERKLIKHGQRIVVVSDIRAAGERTMSIQIRELQ